MSEFWAKHGEKQITADKTDDDEATQGNPPKSTRWPKGVSGNPNGRPRLTPELKQIKDLNPSTLRRMISRYWGMNQQELSQVLADPDTPAIDAFLAKTVMLSIEKGDPLRAEFLFKRSLGNVQENIKLGIKSLRGKTTEQKLEAGRAAIQFLEAQKLQKSDDEDLDDDDEVIEDE